MINLIKSKKSKFKPHIAVCHMDPLINGGSANEENIALVLKAKEGGVKLNTILKALGENADVLEKATYRNLQKQLEAALMDKYSAGGEHSYVWVTDFDESSVVYEYKDTYYSMNYELTENDIVTLKGEAIEAVRHEIYTNVEGDALVLKGAEEVSESLEATSDEEQEEIQVASEDVKENKESTVTEETVQPEVEKLDVEAIIAKAKSDARAEFEAEYAEAELLKSTGNILKSFDFIEEADLSVLVKALVSVEGADLIIKSFESAKTAIDAANAEVVKAKEEFGNKPQQSLETTPETVKLSMAQQMKANVDKVKASKKA